MTDNNCKGAYCDREARFKGYCPSHHRQFLRNGTTFPLNSHKYGPICVLPGCGEKHVSIGLCRNHNIAYRKMKLAEGEERGCSLSNCSFLHYANDLCYHHYDMSRAHKRVEYFEEHICSKEQKRQQSIKGDL